MTSPGHYCHTKNIVASLYIILIDIVLRKDHPQQNYKWEGVSTGPRTLLRGP